MILLPAWLAQARAVAKSSYARGSNPLLLREGLSATGLARETFSRADDGQSHKKDKGHQAKQ
jgi:hypothetical protein